MKRQILLITGGTGKLGRLLVRHFLEKGHVVIATGRSEDSIRLLEREHETAQDRLHVFAADFTREGAANLLASVLAEQGLMPDGLINNARCLEFLQVDANGTVPRSNFVNEFVVDVVAPYELTLALTHQDGSCLQRIVNIGSQYGLVAANPSLYADARTQSPLHYSVAKAALAHLTRELAVRLASKKVQVNCVAFGGIEGRVDEAFRSKYASLCPMGRMLTAADVPGPVEFLLSDASAGMTGQVVLVDGGWSVW